MMQVYVFYEAVATMLSEKGPHVSLDRVAVQVRRHEAAVVVGESHEDD